MSTLADEFHLEYNKERMNGSQEPDDDDFVKSGVLLRGRFESNENKLQTPLLRSPSLGMSRRVFDCLGLFLSLYSDLLPEKSVVEQIWIVLSHPPVGDCVSYSWH